MHAITLKQPWAYAILHLGKRVENRTRKPPAKLIGRRIAIHAGMSVEWEAFDWMRAHGLYSGERLTLEQVGVGGVVATAVLRGWARSDAAGPLGGGELVPEDVLCDPWFTGPVGHVLAGVRVLATPIPCRGQLGYWTLPDDVAAEIAQQERA